MLTGNPLDLKAHNPNYIGDFLARGQGSGGNIGIFGPNYKTARSVQMNIGFQREIKPGTVLSADFVRNVGTHSLLSIDLNHDGSIKNFNLAGAQQAISDTLAACGATSIQDAISGHNCAALDGSTGGNPNPATISDFANFGLSNAADQGGTGCQVALGHPCAFGGKNAAGEQGGEHEQAHCLHILSL